MHPIKKQSWIILSLILASVAIMCNSCAKTQEQIAVETELKHLKDSLNATVLARVIEVQNINIDDQGYCSAQYTPITTIERVSKYFKKGDMIRRDTVDDVLYIIDSIIIK